ncbi:MAG: MlaD family protein [Verrucomicrobiota bacterium]|jgi:phospholipid/cholesterol/gamma-HCH transport system substrate-binding protein
MKNTLETRLGIFFALAIIAGIIVFELLGGLDFFEKGYRVRARFNNIHEIKVGDPVKMAGVPIGQVEKLGFANNRVEVTLKLDEEAVVKTDSIATVKFAGLLGQNYVSVDFGSPGAPRASENTLLETVEQADLGTLMSKLENVATGVENLTKSFSGDNLGNLLGPFTDFLRENSPRLTTILENMKNVSTQIADGKGTVGRLIMQEDLYNNALAAVTNLNSSADELKLTLAQARTVVDNINQGQGTIGKLAKDETLYNEATAAMTNMKEIFQKINQGQGTVGKLVNDETMFKNVKLTLQKVEKATEGLEDQGPLSVLGIAVNSLF